jgi:hypothetical protein
VFSPTPEPIGTEPTADSLTTKVPYIRALAKKKGGADIIEYIPSKFVKPELAYINAIPSNIKHEDTSTQY